VLGLIVEPRVGSSTLGRWDAVLLDAVDRWAVYVAEGLDYISMALSTSADYGR
jgi:dTDP-4-dehydrorhamnose 3,5-epimerase